MVTEVTSGSSEENVVVPKAEMRWALASLVSFVTGVSFLVAHLVAKDDTLLYIGVCFIAVFGVCRFRLKTLEERHDPKRFKRGPLVAYFIILALLFPFIAGLFTIAFAIAALVKGDSLLSAIGRGVTTGAGAVLAIGLLEILGRVARAVVARSPPPPLP